MTAVKSLIIRVCSIQRERKVSVSHNVPRQVSPETAVHAAVDPFPTPRLPCAFCSLKIEDCSLRADIKL